MILNKIINDFSDKQPYDYKRLFISLFLEYNLENIVKLHYPNLISKIYKLYYPSLNSSINQNLPENILLDFQNRLLLFNVSSFLVNTENIITTISDGNINEEDIRTKLNIISILIKRFPKVVLLMKDVNKYLNDVYLDYYIHSKFITSDKTQSKSKNQIGLKERFKLLIWSKKLLELYLNGYVFDKDYIEYVFKLLKCIVINQINRSYIYRSSMKSIYKNQLSEEEKMILLLGYNRYDIIYGLSQIENNIL